MSYPLTSALDVIYRRIEDTWSRERKPCPPVVVELVSCIERALNFGHTGNVAVIARGLMNRLWVGLSLIELGTPMFSPSCFFSAKEVSMDAGQYPTHTQLHTPLLASERSQILTYGIQQALVRPFPSVSVMTFIEPCLCASPSRYTSLTSTCITSCYTRRRRGSTRSEMHKCAALSSSLIT